MIARIAALTLAASPAAAVEFTPLVCLFTPECERDVLCDPASFTVEIAPIDHEPGLWFVYDGILAPVRDLTPEGASLQSFITLGSVDREIISVFETGEAIHTRHYYRPGRGPHAIQSFGQCEVL